jgi:hypothetical protein
MFPTIKISKIAGEIRIFTTWEGGSYGTSYIRNNMLSEEISLRDGLLYPENFYHTPHYDPFLYRAAALEILVFLLDM